MNVRTIVSEYPEVFNAKNISYTEEEAIRLVCTSLSKGSDYQKVKFDVHEGYCAFVKLNALGLKKVASEFGKRLLDKAKWHQMYVVCMDICNEMMFHSYLIDDRESALLYSANHDQYNKLVRIEHETRKIYCELLNKIELCLEINKEYVLLSLDKLKTNESCMYKYFYYQCKLLLADEEESPSICLDALNYFENLYFKHSAFIGIFRNKMVDISISQGNYAKVLSMLDIYISEEDEGTMSWFRFMKSKAHTLLLLRDESLSEVLQMVMSHNKLDTLSPTKMEEWNQLNDEWKEIRSSIVIEDAEGF